MAAELLAPAGGADPSLLDTCATTAGKPPARSRNWTPQRISRRDLANPLLRSFLRADPALGRWAYHRHSGQRIARQLDRAGRPVDAARLRSCGELLIYGDHGRLLGPNVRCGSRLCPICQSYRSTKWAHRVRDVAAELAARPSQWALLTLTIRNVPIAEVGRAVRDLHRAVKRLTLRREFAATGWIRQTEISINASDQTAHPHLHLLLELPADYYRRPLRITKHRRGGRPRIEAGYMNQRRLVALWRQVARLDYQPVVDIRAVNLRDPDERTAAILEVAKYGVKPAELASIDMRQLGTFADQLRGSRAYGIGGSLRAPFRAARIQERDSRGLERVIARGNAEGPLPAPRVITAVAVWNPAHRRYQRHEITALPASMLQLADPPQPKHHPWVPTRPLPRLPRLDPAALDALLDEFANRGDAWEPEPAGARAPALSWEEEDERELIRWQFRQRAKLGRPAGLYHGPPMREDE